jgi:hypothetical protein
MKKAIKLFLRFMILVGLLFPTSGYGPRVSADGGGVSLNRQKGPPAKMCVGDRAMVLVMGSYRYPGKVHIGAEAAGGTLSQLNWTFPKGWGLIVASAEFQATEAGDGKIIFSSREGGAIPVVFPFKIVDCYFDIKVDTLETKFGTLASFQTIVEGNGKITAKDGNISGKGTYTVSENIRYKDPATGFSCASTSPIQGQSSFTVSGSQSDTILNISLNFSPAEVSGSEFECVDDNGRTSSVTNFIQGTSDAQSYLPLTGISVTPWVVYPFTCGSKGRGALSVIPRSEP